MILLWEFSSRTFGGGTNFVSTHPPNNSFSFFNSESEIVVTGFVESSDLKARKLQKNSTSSAEKVSTGLGESYEIP